MTYHQSSAVSVATVLAAATVVLVGYRFGRTHAAWRDARDARRAVRETRREAWSQAVQFAGGLFIVLLTLFATAFHAAR